MAVTKCQISSSHSNLESKPQHGSGPPWSSRDVRWACKNCFLRLTLVMISIARRFSFRSRERRWRSSRSAKRLRRVFESCSIRLLKVMGSSSGGSQDARRSRASCMPQSSEQYFDRWFCWFFPIRAGLRHDGLLHFDFHDVCLLLTR